MTSCGIFPSGDFRPGSPTKATTLSLVGLTTGPVEEEEEDEEEEEEIYRT